MTHTLRDRLSLVLFSTAISSASLRTSVILVDRLPAITCKATYEKYRRAGCTRCTIHHTTGLTW
uniref:Uncharacterized protein n=1 Tax=Pristionchus pacificus TaxID=54126 RepID=A0A2A6BV16_PRIPA|eukprot:PDM69666.1 hypothetical protein PRIPAC_44762 [Pristionchus pacificus]